ncbi:MAG: M48 family metalloprotease [Planctomycetota bacterium]
MPPKTLNTSAVRQVVRDHGGWSECVEHRAYAEYLLGQLTPGLDASVGFTPRIRVVATAEPAALAVTPGDVLVSEGLLDWATADEARAAIAHELGHLVEAECGVVSSLLGKAGMGCPEARADRFGVGLLEIAGHDPAAMGTLLKRLADHPAIGEEVRHHLAHRHGLTHLH